MIPSTWQPTPQKRRRFTPAACQKINNNVLALKYDLNPLILGKNEFAKKYSCDLFRGLKSDVYDEWQNMQAKI